MGNFKLVKTREKDNTGEIKANFSKFKCLLQFILIFNLLLVHWH
jgi:hypothetical protein